jgi:protein-tyrosine phosphatase
MYYDLHAHILPAVDDGAKSFDDTIEMARVAASDGTEVILATPHRKDVTQEHSVEHVETLVAEINKYLTGQGIGVSIVLGMENHLDIDLPDEFTAGRALRMNGTRYALVELPFFGHPNFVSEVLFQIQLQGITPVLAHPERIEYIQNNPLQLAEFAERGMLSQITGGSITGHFGANVRKFTHTLLRRGLVHIIASDCHFPQGPRSPLLTPSFEAAAQVVGRERAMRMVVDTPRAVLEDRPVETQRPLATPAQRSWWRFW